MKFNLKKKRKFSTTRIIILGFFTAAVVGTLLLMLPISSAAGVVTKPIDALFTATTSVCVTGLVTVNTFENWSLFGQAVILVLIQFGGLGIITFTTTILLILRRRITLKERMLIQEAYNLDTLRGMVRLTRKILKGTMIIEGIGALLYATVFIPEFGFLPGIWRAVFNSVSAFCNAGMDILGPDSLCPYRGNVLVNVTTCLLIILGGIGFPVWWDVVRIIKLRMEEPIPLRRLIKRLELHSKIALVMTGIMIVGGMVLILAMEYQNPDTLGGLPLWEKLMSALFQSVTLRTAGFATIAQQYFRADTTFLFILFMFIGGSPSGTAGGVKTVTIAVLTLAVISIIRGRQDVEAFGRRIPDSFVKKALAVVGIGIGTLCFGVIALCLVEDKEFLDLSFEVVSAMGTVGLSRGITAALSLAGKLIIIVTMFLGRVGPISMALAFNRKTPKALRHLPDDKIMVG